MCMLVMVISTGCGHASNGNIQLVMCMLVMVISTGCVHASNGNIN